MNTNQNSHNRGLLGMLLGAPEICPEAFERRVQLSLCIRKIHRLKRHQATGLPRKILKAKKGNSEQKSNHTGSSKRTHTTLPGSCCAGSAKPQKTAILVVSQIDIGIYKALFCVTSGYPVQLIPLYTNNLKYSRSDVRLALARR